VTARKLALVEDGCLRSWLLDCATARELDLTTTGHAHRGVSSVPSPGPTNLYMEAGRVRPEDLARGRLHAERFELPRATAEHIRATRAAGGRVVAVGTTSARVLESCVDDAGDVTPRRGETELFLAPGDRFRAVDALLTNFHLPRSSLLLLVAAFAGRERVLDAYADAIRSGYRFYSYGDAMLIR